MSSERQLDNTNNPWWGEHLHRYEAAARLFPSNGLTVLDIACGSGFGSHYIAQLGNTVVGADISADTVNECNLKYKRNKLSFRVIDGTEIPYPDETFDVIISFETIEHTAAYQKMLNEFRRVVKKNGMIILSTPNFLINSPGGVIINKYHTQEWIYEDLLVILNSTFSQVELLGQEYIRYKGVSGIRYKFAQFFENMLYAKGFRKLPISMQDKIMQFFIAKPMYPLVSDYSFTKNSNEIKKCKTFFAICKA